MPKKSFSAAVFSERRLILPEKKQNYLRGAALLTATVIITKIIGAIYKIPLYNILGDEGTTHFQVIYTIYNLLLTISTAGIPVALSRLISASAATNRPLQSKRYFSVGLMTFVGVGIIGMLVMFIFAQDLANLMGDHEVATGVRSLAPAVLFACIDAVYRGYSQGYGNMMPTAISQIMEVTCKLIFGLAIAWIFVSHGFDSPTIAAGAIVGVTIGLGLAIPILVWYKGRMDRKMAAPSAALDVPLSRKSTMAQILKIGIPITLGSSILNIITLIDTKLVLMRLQSGAGFGYETAKVLYGVYSKGMTLFNIPSSFITPIAVSVVPFISAALAKKNHLEAKNVMESSMKVTNLFAMPAAVGIFVLAEPIFTVLYPNSNEMGPSLLAVLGIASLFVCTYIITNSILQAGGHEKLALLAMPIGGIVKIVVNWILVGTPSINISGAPIGTLLCYVAITALNIVFMLTKLEERPNFAKISIGPALCSIVMGVAAWAVYSLLSSVGSGVLGTGRLATTVYLAVSIVIAVIVYGILIIVTKTITKEDMKLIPKGEKIAKLLKIR